MKGFTLIEVLIVIAIVAVMTTTVISAVRRGNSPQADFDIVERQIVDEFHQARSATVSGTAPVGVDLETIITRYEITLTSSGYTSTVYNELDVVHPLHQATLHGYVIQRPCVLTFTTAEPIVTATSCPGQEGNGSLVTIPILQTASGIQRFIDVHTQTGWTVAR